MNIKPLIDFIRGRRNLLYVGYIFTLIFAPPLIPHTNTFHILFFVTVLLILKEIGFYSTYFKSLSKPVGAYLFLLGVACVYFLIRMAVSFSVSPVEATDYINNSYKLIMTLIPIPICVLFITGKLKKHNKDFWFLTKIVVSAGILQSLFTTIMLVMPEVREFLINLIFASSGTELSSIPTWELNRRYYAYAASVLDLFGYATGIISTLPLLLALKFGPKYLLLVPPLVLTSLLNSVTGVVIFMIGLIITLPLFAVKWGGVKLIRYGVISSCLILVLSSAFAFGSPDSFRWVGRELSTIASIGQSEDSENSSISRLFSGSMWEIPSDISGVLLGEGHSVYKVDGYNHSDVGYINTIWLGGILGFILLYLLPLLSFILYILKTNTLEIYEKSVLTFLVSTFYIFELKAFGIGYTHGYVVLVLLLFSLSQTKLHTNKP